MRRSDRLGVVPAVLVCDRDVVHPESCPIDAEELAERYVLGQLVNQLDGYVM